MSRREVTLGAAAPMIEIQPQPDDRTCGPTCLHAVYTHFRDSVDLPSVIDEVPYLDNGGTLGVLLANHALGRGYRARIYTYNLTLFDPTWFDPGADLPAKLRAQMVAKPDLRLQAATLGYLRYLEMGGEMVFEELTPELLVQILEGGTPFITGVSATYLYGCPREIDDRYDDVRGAPAGHFVVVGDYDHESGQFDVADPLQENPLFRRHHYRVSAHRLIGAILLGIVTHDANLVVLDQ